MEMEEIRMNIKNNKNCKITINDEIISVSEKEKTADELFKELGYEKNEDIRTDLGCVYHIRVKHYVYIEFPKIIFHNKSKSISIQKDYISIKELQAINKKCQELGWL